MTTQMCPNCGGYFYLEQDDAIGGLCSEKCAKEYQEFVEKECDHFDGMEAKSNTHTTKMSEDLRNRINKEVQQIKIDQEKPSMLRKELSRTFDIMKNGWDGSLPITDKDGWVDVWATTLREFTPHSVRAVTEHVLESYERSPMLSEFYQLCKAHSLNKSLDISIASDAEKWAKELVEGLSDDECCGVDFVYETQCGADACLIAACVLLAKINMRADLPVDELFVEKTLLPRMNMFAHEMLIWQKQASNGKGFWVDELGGQTKEK